MSTATAEKQEILDQAAWFEIAERTLPGAGLGGYSLPDEVRFIIAKGAGTRVQAVDGRWYVDYVGGAGANILGHCHPAVVAAIQAQANEGLHFFGSLNRVAVELSELLVDTIPCAEKIMFTTTGSEATSYAMRVARAATGKDRVLKFEGAYHGNHDYASVSQFPTQAANYPHAGADSGGVPQVIPETMFVAPYNDLEATTRIVEEHKDEIAAIIVEPVQRIIFGQREFLEGLRKLCDATGIVLIFDEVVTGFRLSLQSAQGYFGVTPDLATFGKIVGGGGPLGCVAGKESLIELTNPRKKGQPDYAYINGTLHGNPIAAAAGIATIKELSRPGLYAAMGERSEHFKTEAQAVLDRHGVPAIVAGRQTFWQILFMENEPRDQIDVLNSDMAAMRKLDVELLRRGIYVLPGVRRFHSAIDSDADLALTLEALDGACEAL